MIKNYFIYVIPPLGGINIEMDPEKSGWEKAKHPSFADCSEYKKQINYNGNEWTIVFRKYKLVDAVSFIIKGYLDTNKKTEILRDVDMLFYKSKMECGAIATVKIVKFILNLFENVKDSDNREKEICYIFSEKSQDCELNCIDEEYYNLKFNYDHTINESIIDSITTVLALSQIAYHFEPYIFNKKDLMEKLNIHQEDLIKEFWRYKFLLLNSPASQAFPAFFKNKISIIDNLLDYRRIKLMENHNAAIKVQNKLLNEIEKTESGILYLTLFVSTDVIFNFLYEIAKLFGFFTTQNENILTLIILIGSAAVSLLVFIYIIPRIRKNKKAARGQDDG